MENKYNTKKDINRRYKETELKKIKQKYVKLINREKKKKGIYYMVVGKEKFRYLRKLGAYTGDLKSWSIAEIIFYIDCRFHKIKAEEYVQEELAMRTVSPCNYGLRQLVDYNRNFQSINYLFDAFINTILKILEFKENINTLKWIDGEFYVNLFNYISDM